MPSDDSDYTPSPSRRPRTGRRASQQPYNRPDSCEDSDNDSEPNAKLTRERKGCLSCRVRRKKCPDELVDGEAPEEPCEACTRLHIECLGWASKRPKWMKNKPTFLRMKRAIKEHTNGPAKNMNAKPTLSLEPFYKGRGWNPPFPVLSPTHIPPELTTHDQSSPSAHSVRSNTPPSDDEQHDTKEFFHPYPSPEITHPQIVQPDLYTREPMIVPTQLADKLPLDTEATYYREVVPSSRPFLQLEAPEAVSYLPSQSQYTPVSDASTLSWSAYPSSDSEHGSDTLSPPSDVNANTIVVPSEWRTDGPAYELVNPPPALMYYAAPSEPTNTHPLTPDTYQYNDQTDMQSPTLFFQQQPNQEPDPQQYFQQPLPPDFNVESLINLSPTYVYQLPLPMNSPGHLAFSEWHQSVSKFMYRFIPQSELSPFELSEFVFGSGKEHPETYDATRNLTRLHHLGVTEHYTQTSPATPSREKIDAALMQDEIMSRLRKRSAAQPGEPGNVVGALFGVSFSLFTGGSACWRPSLEIACRWVVASWPNIANGSVAPIAKLFVGITAWFDILGAVSLRVHPMLDIRLLNEILADDSEVQLKSIMGCENRVMLAIAHIAELAFLQRAQPAASANSPPISRSFDSTAAARYASFIKSLLQPAQSPPPFVGPLPASPTTAWVPPPNVFDPAGSAFYGSSPVSEASPMFPTGSIWADSTIPTSTVTTAFRAAANVFLETTLSSYSAAPLSAPTSYTTNAKVAYAVDVAVSVLRQIPVSDADRSMVWPLCVVGCQVTRPEDKQYFHERFSMLDGRERLGNGATVERFMHYVWANGGQSAAMHGGRDWIDLMRPSPILLA